MGGLTRCRSGETGWKRWTDTTGTFAVCRGPGRRKLLPARAPRLDARARPDEPGSGVPALQGWQDKVTFCVEGRHLVRLVLAERSQESRLLRRGANGPGF